MAWNTLPRRRAELARRPSDPFELLEQHVQRFFEQPWAVITPSETAGGESAPLATRLDVSDRGDELVLEVEMPGVSEEDIDLSITDDVLRLRAEKRDERKEERKGWYLSERSFGIFERAIRLPVEVESDRAVATYERGVLQLVLPKSVRSREETKRISIRPGDARPEAGRQRSELQEPESPRRASNARTAEPASSPS